MQSVSPKTYSRLLLVSALALTGCRFNGDFDFDYNESAGSGGGWSPGGIDAGTPQSGQGGGGAGGAGGAATAGHSGHGGAGHAGHAGAGTGGAGAGGAGVGGEPESGSGGVAGDPSIGGQGGDSQGGSGSDLPTAGQGDDYPVAGSGDDEPIAGSGDEGPPTAGSGDEDPPVAGSGDDEPEGGAGGAGSGGGGSGGVGGAGQGGAGGSTSTEPLHDLEVTAFRVFNDTNGYLDIAAGEVMLGSVTFHNPNDRPFPIDQIVLAGRPPGGTNAGGPYLDLIPRVGGPVTIEPNGDITYSGSRTFKASDPLGVWRFYPTWQANNQWHDDGGEQTIEVIKVGECRDNDRRCVDATPFCSAAHVCVACLEDTQCNAGQKCSQNSCVTACGDGILDSGEDCETGYLNSDASNCDFATCKRKNYVNCLDTSVTCPSGTACLGGGFCTPTSDKNCVVSCPEVPGMKSSCAQGVCYLDCSNSGPCPSDMKCTMASPDGTLVTAMCFAK